MFLKSKLLLVLILTIVATSCALCFLYSFAQENAALNKVSRDSRLLTMNVFELNLLTNDVLLHGETRAIAQWQEKYQSSKILFEQLNQQEAETNGINGDILESYNNLKKNFDQLAALLSAPNTNVSSIELRDKLMSNISINSQNIVFNTFQISEELYTRTSILQNRIYYTGLLILALLFVLIMSIIYIFYHNVFQPINELTTGAEHITAGDYGHKISINGLNEFTLLSESFNRMSQAILDDQKKILDQAKHLQEGREEMVEQNEAVLNVLEDIEEEKRRSEDLALDLQKFKLAVDNANDEVLIADAQKKVIYANNAATAIIGLPVEKIVGQQLGVWWDHDENTTWYQQMWNQVDTKRTNFTKEISGTRQNGYGYTIDLFLQPILHNNKTIFYIAIVHDITKIKEVDRAKSEFVSVASHQLRTPLTGIKWSCELALKENLGELVRSYVKEIDKSNNRIVKLVSDLLDVSRIETGQKFDVIITQGDIIPIIKDTIVNQESTSKEKEVSLETAESLPEKLLLPFDGLKMAQVWQNLISNAIKYAFPESTVVIGCQDTAKEVIFSVKNNGIGIPQTQKEHIFERFFRADNASTTHTDGTGLGLYIAKAIIDGHGGKIWFESEENKETTFYFSLPKKSSKIKS